MDYRKILSVQCEISKTSTVRMGATCVFAPSHKPELTPRYTKLDSLTVKKSKYTPKMNSMLCSEIFYYSAQNIVFRKL